ncbi:MAG: hypothetical protein DRR08_09335 [Candidatus Parabeggiatoa sp. nov. 2]|nr:MAG: hypothetical protein DRR08_09335 [Gammaproteobacteria bacterium]
MLPQSMTHKIWVRATGKETVATGEFIEAHVDMCFTHDPVLEELRELFYQEFGQEAKVWEPHKIALFQDHLVPAKDASCRRLAIAMDKFSAEQKKQLRPETATLIKQLHQRGLKLYILSGDHQQPTQHLAQRLNIDEFFAEVLPEGKADMIKQLQQQGHKVCFVGDGINDAIALQQADVSVSLRGATTVATDSAQIVLVSQSLQQLDQLFEIANGFKKNLNRTMLLSYIPGSVLIGGVFLFHFGMPAALLLYGSGLTAAMTNALAPMLQLPKEPSECRIGNK